MDLFQLVVGLAMFLIMGSLAFHIFASPYFNDALSDDSLSRVLSHVLYRWSKPLALIAVWLCVCWGFERMFFFVPLSWSFETESGNSISYRQALGFLLGFVATGIIGKRWSELQNMVYERRLELKSQRLAARRDSSGLSNS